MVGERAGRTRLGTVARCVVTCSSPRWPPPRPRHCVQLRRLARDRAARVEHNHLDHRVHVDHGRTRSDRRGSTLTKVAAVQAPTAMAVRADDDTLFVTEQAGRVRAIRNGALDPTPVIDLRDTIASGGERGLLGLTFSPDGQTLYVDSTNKNGDTRVDVYAMKADGTADRGSRRLRDRTAPGQPQRRQHRDGARRHALDRHG